MTTLSLFFQSYGIGFVAAATLGPIALLIIQRTLKDGWKVGAASGFGVALADSLFGLAGALGLAALTKLLVDNQFWIRLVGGGILVYLGIKAVWSAGQEKQAAEERKALPAGLAGSAGSIFLLTLTNPMTIMFFSATYVGLASGEDFQAQLSAAGVLAFAGGVLLGSFSWWVILTGIVAAARQRFRLERLAWLTRASGVLIAGLGGWICVQALGGF